MDEGRTIGPEEGGYEPPDSAGLELAGDSIGPYRLKHIIGEGGLGVVWLAERIEGYRQLVAIKFIRGVRDSRLILVRFRRERQALGLMEHDHIAKVHDAGISPRGRPYIVMEYVRGEPITAYCDRKRLSIEQRLKLFIKACEAVQHAHLKGVIHRDLTPRNILAFDGEGGEASLKVIDFGLAKPLGDAVPLEPDRTEPGEMVGTIDYMSPEQASASVADIDTRTDIYALGVILYELVTGTLPFDLRKRARIEICRIKREETPPAPSIRLSQVSSRDGESRSRIERARRAGIQNLVRQLRSELDWIPLKAIRIEPERRYQTAFSFATDIRNYLENRPLEAGPPSWPYRIGKFMRRHRVAAGVGAGFVATLLIGVVLVLQQWRAAVLARAEAEDVTGFLVDDLFGAGDVDRFDRATTLFDIVRVAEPSIEERFKGQPRRESRILRALGRSYLAMGEYESARRLFDDAILAGAYLLTAEERLSLQADLVESLYRLGGAQERDRAVELARQTVVEAEADPSVHPALVATAWNQLGGALKRKGSWPEAAEAYGEALELRGRVLPAGHLDLATIRYNLLLVEAAMARDPSFYPAAAERAGRGAAAAGKLEALGIEVGLEHGRRRQLRISILREAAAEWIRAVRQVEDDESAIPAAETRAGWITRAERLLGELEPVAREALGPMHPRYWWIRGDQASVAELRGDAEKSVELLRSIFADLDERAPWASPDLVHFAVRLASLMDRAGTHDAAVAEIGRAIDRSTPELIPNWRTGLERLQAEAERRGAADAGWQELLDRLTPDSAR